MSERDLSRGFRIGEFAVDPGRARIAGPDGERTLAGVELALLVCLAERAPRPVDRGTLKLRALGDAAAADDALAHGIHSLRQRLGDSGRASRYVVTVPRVGYALVAEVVPVADSRAPAGGSVVAANPPEPARSPAPSAGPAAAIWQSVRERWWLRATIGYSVPAFAVVQGVNALLAALQLPMFAQTLVALLALAGYPLTLALVWAGGPEDAPQTAASTVRRQRVGRFARRAVLGLVLVATLGGVFVTAQAIRERGADEGAEAVASLAVLPLVDVSPEQANPQLAQGIAEELSSRFFQMGLRVVPQVSVARYRGRSFDARRIGRELGVSHVMHGSLLQAAPQLRLIVYLTDTRSGNVTWQQTFDSQRGDLLTIQNELSAAAAGALNVVLTESLVEQLRETDTDDQRAHHYYVLGMGEFRQSADLSQLDKAVELLEKAVAADPGYARAHAGLCRVGVTRFGRLKSPEALVQAESACMRALEGGAGLIETELALGNLYVATGRYRDAEEVHRRLIARSEGGPVDADALIGLGQALAGQERLAEAEESLRAAVAAESRYWRAHSALGSFLLDHGRTREAAEEYRALASLLPGSASALINYGAVLLELGEYALAESRLRRSLEIEAQPNAYSNLATLMYFRGQYREAVEQYALAANLGGEHYTILGNMADALWQIDGRREAAVATYRGAIALGERALQAGDSSPELFALLAFYNARVGNGPAAGDLLREAVATGSQRYKVLYYGALTALELGDRQRATALLGQALERGCPSHLVTAERSFERLAGLPAYEQLLPRPMQRMRTGGNRVASEEH